MSKAEKTRALIIEKTAPLFNRKGYAGTSLSDMTEATGLTKGSIYGNFSGKDEVALAVFDFHMRSVQKRMRQMMENKASAREKLLTYVDFYSALLTDRAFPEGGCPLLNTSIEADDTHPALRRKAAVALKAWQRLLAEIVAEGRTHGEFQSPLPDEHIALCLIAMLEGGVMIARLTQREEDRSVVMQSVERYIRDL